MASRLETALLVMMLTASQLLLMTSGKKEMASSSDVQEFSSNNSPAERQNAAKRRNLHHPLVLQSLPSYHDNQHRVVTMGTHGGKTTSTHRRRLASAADRPLVRRKRIRRDPSEAFRMNRKTPSALSSPVSALTVRRRRPPTARRDKVKQKFGNPRRSGGKMSRRQASMTIARPHTIKSNTTKAPNLDKEHISNRTSLASQHHRQAGHDLSTGHLMHHPVVWHPEMLSLQHRNRSYKSIAVTNVHPIAGLHISSRHPPVTSVTDEVHVHRRLSGPLKSAEGPRRSRNRGGNLGASRPLKRVVSRSSGRRGHNGEQSKKKLPGRALRRNNRNKKRSRQLHRTQRSTVKSNKHRLMKMHQRLAAHERHR